MSPTSVTCPQCGAANATGVPFCANCGSFLNWDEPESDAKPTDASPAVATAARPRAAAEDSAPTTAIPRIAPERPPEPVPTVPLTAPVETPSGTVVTPPADTAVPSVQPAEPVERPKPAPAPTEPVERAPGPGERFCWQCGRLNAAGRTFCENCAARLDAAPTAGGSDAPEAGTRFARRRRVPVGWIVTLVVVLLAAGAGWAYRTPITGGVQSVLDRVLPENPVVPSSVAASSSQDGHGPELLHDGFANTAWAAANPGDARASTSTWASRSPSGSSTCSSCRGRPTTTTPS